LLFLAFPEAAAVCAFNVVRCRFILDNVDLVEGAVVILLAVIIALCDSTADAVVMLHHDGPLLFVLSGLFSPPEADLCT
jgi:hypothetical protein